MWIMQKKQKHEHNMQWWSIHHILEQEEMIGCSMHSNHILSTKVFILKTDKTILWLKQKLEEQPRNKAGISLFSGRVA